MPSHLLEKYKEDPFFKSTVNVVAIQTLLVGLILLVFGTAVWYQRSETLSIIEARRAAMRAGQQVTPESLEILLDDLQDDTFGVSAVVLLVLAIAFGLISARYALAPTRSSYQYQRRFIGNIAHELRTPLSIIRTNTEVSLMDKKVQGHVRDTLALTVEELDRVSEIINNLLTFNSLIRSNQIKKEPVDIAGVLQEVVRRHAELANSRGISLSYEPKSDGAWYVTGNTVALEQVFTNLVKNALNYTPQHDDRSVTVRAYGDDDRVLVSVADTGIGIAQKDLYHVFEPFFRGDTSRSRSVGGGTSGLGLAIVNDIVRAHNGSIIIRSALNRGTTIEISFPRLSTSELQDAIELADDNEEHEARVTEV